MVQAGTKRMGIVITGSVMPDGQGGFALAPDLLDKDGTILYLRIDTLNVKDSYKTLANLQAERKSVDGRLLPRLRPTKIGNVDFYRREELGRFTEAMEKFYAESQRNN